MHLNHGPNIVEVTNLSFSYTSSPVLKNINLLIHVGDYLGIVGPNGGGKSTLLKLMLNLIKPDSGSIKLFGKDVKDFDQWPKIGYVPQKAINFEPNFPASVYEVAAMGRYGLEGLLHYPSANDAKKVREALGHVGMLEFAKRLIGDLSQGQQQRVFIARAIASEPKILFLDEPTVGVDIKAQEEFYTLLTKLNRDLHLTLILVSHDIDVVTNEVTEIACINRELVYHGDPKEFIKEDYINKLYGKGVKFILHGH